MLTDRVLRQLKPRDKSYKVTDHNGMYAVVSKRGTISFRFDYRLNGRRETVTIGRYGHDGISLALAREKCINARNAVVEGRSPAQEKQREKGRLTTSINFKEYCLQWIEQVEFAESTRKMRRSIIDRDVLPAFMALERI